MTANGQKLAWSIADYLGSLDRNVGALLAAPPTPAAKDPKAKAEKVPATSPTSLPEPVLAGAK